MDLVSIGIGDSEVKYSMRKKAHEQGPREHQYLRDERRQGGARGWRRDDSEVERRLGGSEVLKTKGREILRQHPVLGEVRKKG